MTPPRIARWLLTHALRGAARSAIVGDLEEEFAGDVLPRLGARRARRWYWRQAIRSIVDHRVGRPLGWRDRSARPRLRLGDAIWQERETLALDLRQALRLFPRQPGFAAIVVVVLALGFGANLAVFTVANGWLFKPLPVQAPDTLVSVRGAAPGDGGVFPYHMYVAWRDDAAVFDRLAAYARLPLTLRDGNGTDPVVGELVSGNYFETLGVTAARGRALAPDDDLAGAAGAVVLSHRLWTRRFAADPGVVGRVLTLNGVPCAVVGVAPARFFGLEVGSSPDLWLPLQLEPTFSPDRSNLWTRTRSWLYVVGTLSAGVSADAAAADATALLHARMRWDPDERVVLEPTDRFARRQILPTPIALVQGLALTMLLISVVNVAGLLLARSAARQRELAVRASLGAGRARLARLALAEGGVLVAAGVLLGGIVAAPLATALTRHMPGSEPVALDLMPDHRVFLMAVALALLAGAGVGLPPALRAARVDLLSLLKSAFASHGRADSRAVGVRWLLLPAQIALSTLLLVMAGLLARSLQNLHATAAGIEPERVLVAEVSPGDARYTGDRLLRFYADLRTTLVALPGVTSVGLGAHSPLGGTSDWGGPLVVDGVNTRADIHVNRVTPGYVAAAGMPVVAGRDFTDADREGAPMVAAVNEAFARRFLEPGRALERRIQYSVDRPRDVVGIVQDIRFLSLRDEPPPALFIPAAQQPPSPHMTLHMRVRGDARSLVGDLRERLRELDADVGLTDIRTLAAQFDRRLGEERLVTTIAGLFAGLALLLAAAGLYGLISYTVARRTTEMGIRVALGATPASVRTLVLRETLVIVGVGVVLGVPLAWMAARAAGALLFGLTPGDPTVFAATVTAIVATALLAAWLPARRAAHVDPVVALRAE